MTNFQQGVDVYSRAFQVKVNAICQRFHFDWNLKWGAYDGSEGFFMERILEFFGLSSKRPFPIVGEFDRGHIGRCSKFFYLLDTSGYAEVYIKRDALAQYSYESEKPENDVADLIIEVLTGLQTYNKKEDEYKEQLQKNRALYYGTQK